MVNVLGPCRLPYELFENEKKIDSGYLLSTKDLCGLDYLPFLIKSGVKCFKIEGRMKTPEYVATVTRIYRKYIDLALSGEKYIIDNKDRKELLQVFNRGMSSCGHLDKEPNKNLIYPQKPNNMGLPLGIVQHYNKNKGYITIKLQEELCIGDTIALEKETGSYNVSELMSKIEKNSSNNKNIVDKKEIINIPIGEVNKTVVIGRMKGNISAGDKVYKISSKTLKTLSLESIKSENRKVLLDATVTIKRNQPISIKVVPANNIELYKNLDIEYSLDILPVKALNKPLTVDKIVKQIDKTQNTPFKFKNINVNLDNNLFLPKLSYLNELRRIALDQVQKFATTNIKRTYNQVINMSFDTNFNVYDKFNNTNVKKIENKNKFKITLLLNKLNLNEDYSKLEHVDSLYIPLKYFTNTKYKEILDLFSSKFNMYIYLPTIIRSNYRNIFYNNIETTIKNYNIKGFVLSNLSNFLLIEDLYKDNTNKFELIANYTFNIYNNETINELKKLGVSRYIVSAELDKNSILDLYNINCKKEMIVYGKIPLMNINYCLLSKSNKCFPSCNSICSKFNNHYILKDRLNMEFDIIPDNVQTVTTIYNSKTLSISTNKLNLDFARIDILYEDIDEINNIVNIVKSGNRLEGKEFTNGNLNRII